MDPQEARLLDTQLAERLADTRLEAARLDESLAELLRDRADGTADDEHDPEGTLPRPNGRGWPASARR